MHYLVCVSLNILAVISESCYIPCSSSPSRSLLSSKFFLSSVSSFCLFDSSVGFVLIILFERFLTAEKEESSTAVTLSFSICCFFLSVFSVLLHLLTRLNLLGNRVVI